MNFDLFWPNFRPQYSQFYVIFWFYRINIKRLINTLYIILIFFLNYYSPHLDLTDDSCHCPSPGSCVLCVSGSPNWTYVANTRCWIWTQSRFRFAQHKNQRTNPVRWGRVTVTVNKERDGLNLLCRFYSILIMKFGRAVPSPWKAKVCLNYLTTNFWLLHMTLNSSVRRNPITYSCHARHPDEMDAVKWGNYITEVINRCFVAWVGVNGIIRP